MDVSVTRDLDVGNAVRTYIGVVPELSEIRMRAAREGPKIGQQSLA
jgi:hypothetical protein